MAKQKITYESDRLANGRYLIFRLRDGQDREEVFTHFDRELAAAKLKDLRIDQIMSDLFDIPLTHADIEPLKQHAQEMVKHILNVVPACADRSEAVRCIRASLLWCATAIHTDGIA